MLIRNTIRIRNSRQSTPQTPRSPQPRALHVLQPTADQWLALGGWRIAPAAVRAEFERRERRARATGEPNDPETDGAA